MPLALVYVKELPGTLVRRVGHFVADFAPGVAIGIFGADGRRYFEGTGLSGLTKLEERPVDAGRASIPDFNPFFGPQPMGRRIGRGGSSIADERFAVPAGIAKRRLSFAR